MSAYGNLQKEMKRDKTGRFIPQSDVDNRAVADLLKEREFLQVLLDNVQAGIVACDANGELKLFNQAARSFHGLPLQPLPPEQWADYYDLFLPDGKTRMNAEDIPLFRALQGEAVRQVEMMIIPKQGTPRTLLANGQAIVALDGKKLGAVVVMHDITERKQAEEERSSLIQAQAAQLAAETAQQQSAFLAEVSAVLASSLEYEQTLQSIADLAIPRFADWCSVDLLNDDGTISRVAVAHADPEKVQFAWEVVQRFPSSLNNNYGIAQVIKSGKSVITPEITDEELVVIQNQEYLQVIRELGLKSCIIAPLAARSRVLGCISFIYSESDRRYSHVDLLLAEDLARRAAVAIDNARLFQEAQQARQAAEKAADRTARLQTITAALSESLTPEQVADVIVTQSMAALDADSAMMVLLTDDQTELEIIKAVGYKADLLDSWRRFPVATAVPLAEAVRTGIPAWEETKAERLARYPHLADAYSRYEFNSWISLPLMSGGKSLGGLSVSFREYKQLSQDDREFILAVSRQCAQAISRAQAYEAERKARSDAEAANRIKDEFLAVLSHELRSPLNPILGWSRLLQTKKLDDTKVAEALKTIERNARLQAELIEDLLDVSGILRGKLNLNIAAVNPITTIQAAIETVWLSAEAKSIQIKTQFPSYIGQVLGDPSRLQQIFWNLLSNAVKFTPEGGQVGIELEELIAQRPLVTGEVSKHSSTTHYPLPVTHYAQITVTDTGKGISADFLPHVFEYFRQADSTTTRKFGGLGLGLAIVRHLVELHGGTIEAESLGEGQGATFKVQLPLVSGSLPSNVKYDPLNPLLSLNKIKVLVVDDDTDARDFVAFLLEQEGATVMTVSSASEALTVLTQFQPNVLLSDVGMPNMDGYMLMQQVRSLPVEQGGLVPAIALTAYAGEYDQQQALKVGFQKHISKPVEPEVLVKAISELVRYFN